MPVCMIFRPDDKELPFAHKAATPQGLFLIDLTCLVIFLGNRIFALLLILSLKWHVFFQNDVSILRAVGLR